MPLNERGIRMNRRRSIRKTLGTNSYTRDTVPDVYADFFKREQTMVKDFANATKTPKKKKRSRKKHITITAKKDIFEDPMFQPIAKHEDKSEEPEKPEKKPEESEKKPEESEKKPEESEKPEKKPEESEKPEKKPEKKPEEPEKKSEEPEKSEKKSEEPENNLSAGLQKKSIKITCGLTPDKKKGELVL